MHSENASARAPLAPVAMAKPCCCPEPLASPGPPPEPELLLVTGAEPPWGPAAFVVVVVGRWATEAGEVLPHPVTSKAPLTIKTLMNVARGPNAARGLGGFFMSLGITGAQ